ncbi:MAG: hypothetical protein RLZZ292_1909 [Bacteroidota bacterium]|jgi:hypothetical protein
MQKQFLMFFLFASFLACKKKETNTTNNAPQTVNLPTDFEAFYEKFHTDSLYQLQHISFPLKGVPMGADSMSLANGYYFQPEYWVLQHKVDFSDGKYTRDFQLLGENIVTETIMQTDEPYGMQRRFAKLGNEWSLIYYVAMNQVRLQ